MVIAQQDLAKMAFWVGELTPQELERARQGLTERTFAKGAYICHRGDRLDFWTGVVEGLIKISSIAHCGKAMTFAGIGEGGWFGEGSVLKNEPRKYDLVALRDTRLAMLNRATFNWLVEHSVGFNRFLVRQLNERMGQFIATIEYDRTLDPTARVARNLSWLLNPVLYPNARAYIAISQEELALLAGVSRQAANRGLQTLEQDGLIRVERSEITIVDLERLANYEGDGAQ